MQVPHTYAQWVKVLEELKKGTDDEAVLAVMRQGTIEWQSGVAERFSRRLVAAVNARMDQAQDAFTAAQSHMSGGEGELIQALLELRKSYAFLTRVMDLPAIPMEQRTQYISLVRDQADQVQRSLEDSASDKRWDPNGKILSTVRNHRINAY